MTRLFALGICAALTGCLPGDERPPPGSLEVNVAPNEATSAGFTTDDGWTIRYDRFLTALGDIDLNDDDDGAAEDSCNDYAETHYDRLFDFTVADASKVGLVYGLGTCSVEFRLRAPSSDSILGEGTTAQDRELMRIEASDGFAMDERTTLLVRGRAERDGDAKEFFWIFRRSYEITHCERPDGDGFSSIIELAGGDARALGIEIRGQELFRELPSDDAPITFDRFAAADADQDGAILMEELAAVEIPIDPVLEALDDDVPAEVAEVVAAALAANASLATLVYEIMVPRVARLAGSGECEISVRNGLRF